MITGKRGIKKASLKLQPEDDHRETWY